MLDKLEKAVTAKADFLEIRAALSHSSRVRLRQEDVEAAGSGSASGFSARALHKGAWGFAYTSDESKLWEMVERSIRLAKAASKKPMGASLAGTSTARDHVTIKPKKHPLDYSIEDKVKLCRELLPEPRKGVVAYDLEYFDGWGPSYYVNSEGAAIEYDAVRSLVTFSAFSKKGGELLNARESDGGTLGVELLDGKASLVSKVMRKALLLQKAKLPPKGRMPVIIDPKMAGVFAHEMVGHACEGDEVANHKSILEGKLGRMLGSSEVNIVDDPTIPRMFGSFPYDAEGTKARRKQLFKDGRLTEFLQSRETAARLGLEPTGNARASSLADFPIVRMSNTFFERGDHAVDELFEGVNGVYVSGMKGGVVDPSTGVFQFASEYGYLVEHGQKTTPLRDITLVGSIIDTLRHVEACGNDFELGHPGMCGKSGQMVPVSDGGPHIRIKEMLVG